MRRDLLELGTDALMALANPGFVKRALREIADGQLPEVAEAVDGTVSARYSDGHTATLAPGRSVRDARCSCPASGLCRHRVTLVPAYQHWVQAQAEAAPAVAEPSVPEAPWSPADFDDAALAASLPPATLALAERLAAAHPVIRVLAWSMATPVPAAHLPMCSVRFFSRSNLLLARCDCKVGSACEHIALAVWAFRQATSVLATQPAASIELMRAGTRRDHEPGDALAVVAPEIDALLLQLWLDGTSQSPAVLEARFERVRSLCSDQGWHWVLENIDRVRELLAAQHARSSRFNPRELLHVLAQLPGRLAAAQHAQRSAQQGVAPPLPAPQILGQGVSGELALDHLRLVSLGLECWREDAAEGVRIVFADADTQALTVLDRSWPLVAGATPGSLLARRVAGHSVRQLGGGQVVTRGARRRANGQIEIASGVRQTSLMPLSARSWDSLAAPLRQPDARALAAWLRELPPDCVRASQAIEHLHILPVRRVLGWGWDAASQALHAVMHCGPAEADLDAVDAADVLYLDLPHQNLVAPAIDALARALAGGCVTAVAGTVKLRAGELWMRPWSVVSGEQMLVLQAQDAPAQVLPLQPVATASSALAQTLERAFELLERWMRQGLRHQSGSAQARAEAEARALDQAGFGHCASALGGILEQSRAADRSLLPERLCRLILLLEEIERSA